ncbi:MAG: thioredoxin domain-containing protein [Pseudomonadota bacterium]
MIEFSKLLPRAALLAAPLFVLAACADDSLADAPKKAGDAAAAAPDVDAETVLPSDKVVGSADAPVTVFEYASVTCPGCAAAHAQLLPDIKKEFVETGKVRIVFREYPKAPSSLERQSYLGSLIARCAADKSGDKAYFAVIENLLATQRTWITGDTYAELKKIAVQAGLNDTEFDDCVKTREDLLQVINKNIDIAENTHKLTGTPTFFIGEKKLNVGKLREELYEALGEEPPAEDVAEEAGAEPAAADAGEDAAASAEAQEAPETADDAEKDD